MKMYILYRHAEANSYTVCSTVTGFLISEAIDRFVPLVKDLNFVNWSDGTYDLRFLLSLSFPCAIWRSERISLANTAYVRFVLAKDEDIVFLVNFEIATM